MSDSEINGLVEIQLDNALQIAEQAWAAQSPPSLNLSRRLQTSLDEISKNVQSASTAFTNIVTCLAIKAARPDIDIRYHQVQIQGETSKPAGFNFRGVSEVAIYPWLSRNKFGGAKSGWQTRTMERPKPYTMDYAENIGRIKGDFLAIFDEIEEKNQPAKDALIYLIYKQVVARDASKITLSVPKTKDISTIVRLFEKHFFYSYKGSRGASRLPVLAIQAIYSVMVPQLRRFENHTLNPLKDHSAADSQTGSLGDVEVVDKTGKVFEAVEVKHGQLITEVIATDVQGKIMDKSVDRYYILTTHANCEVNAKTKQIFENIRELYNCQIIANGVMSSLKYYLRLLEDPSVVFKAYVDLLHVDTAIGHEHRVAWNDVVK